MKKWIALILMIFVVLENTGCRQTNVDQVGQGDKSIVVETETKEEETIDRTEMEFEQLEFITLSQEKKDMLLVLDAINLTMDQYQTVYNGDDEVFFWRALGTLLKEYAYTPQREVNQLVIKEEENNLYVIAEELVASFGRSIYVHMDELPVLPEAADVMEDAKEDLYDVSIPEERTSYTQIISWKEYEDKSCEVITQLRRIADDQLILKSEYQLSLDEDFNLNQSLEGAFSYRVSQGIIMK